ncbi:MAG: LicD family protein [Treponema sp.]|jgi:lipopolysaccharide cholinephosphotransferase|nr:LicD family protein [Treponema sp.]
MEQETMNKLRGVMLEILNEFVHICKENNLIYFLTGGTLLGAVRHKGFIPWDDDIDVAMPRSDYEKFLDIYDKNNNSNYYTLSYRSLQIVDHNNQFAKLCKKGTVFADKFVNPSMYSGIYIDIFPFDNCVLFFAPVQTKLIRFILKLFRYKAKIVISKKRYKRIICGILCLFFSAKFLNTLHFKLHILFNKFKTKHISFFSARYGYKKETHKYSELLPLSKVSFEGNEYYAPCNFDLFLTEVYGNYMELPPVEKRETHNPLYIKFQDA